MHSLSALTRRWRPAKTALGVCCLDETDVLSNMGKARGMRFMLLDEQTTQADIREMPHRSRLETETTGRAATNTISFYRFSQMIRHFIGRDFPGMNIGPEADPGVFQVRGVIFLP